MTHASSFWSSTNLSTLENLEEDACCRKFVCPSLNFKCFQCPAVSPVGCEACLNTAHWLHGVWLGSCRAQSVFKLWSHHDQESTSLSPLHPILGWTFSKRLYQDTQKWGSRDATLCWESITFHDQFITILNSTGEAFLLAKINYISENDHCYYCVLLLNHGYSMSKKWINCRRVSLSICSLLIISQMIFYFKMENKPQSHLGPLWKRPSVFNEVMHIPKIFSTGDQLLMCFHCVFVVEKTFVSFFGLIVFVPRALVVGSIEWTALLSQSTMTTGCRNKIRRQNNSVSINDLYNVWK